MLHHFEASAGDIFIVGNYQVTVLGINQEGEAEFSITEIDPEEVQIQPYSLEELCL